MAATTRTITVTGMTCGHCVAAVQEEVGHLPGVQAVDAQMVAERVRRGIQEARPGELDVTASVGVAVALGKAVDFEALYGAADKALYEAKGEGRNRVVLAPIMDTPAERPAGTPRLAEGPSRVPSVPLHGPVPQSS